MGRRRRHESGDAPVSRQEFEDLKQQVRRAIQKGAMGMGIQSLGGGGAAGDDGYEWWFDGRTSFADDADTVAGYTPEEIPYLSDGSAPGSSPTPTVQGGLAFLNAKWTAVANADRVTYEVHLGTDSGFTADATTKVGETPGLQYFIHKDADDAALVYDQDYFVKIIARDADGSAAASAASAAEQLDPAGSDDILVGAITAEKLESVFNIVNTLVAGTPGAQRLEIGYGTDADGNLDGFIGARCFDEEGNLTFRVDGESGEVLLRGDVFFGANSRLYKNQDIIELGEQTALSFEEPYLVQSSSGSRGQSGTAKATWASPTQSDSYLVAVLTITDSDGTAPTPTFTGWTLATEESYVNPNSPGEAHRVMTYYRTGVRSGDETASLGDTVQWSLCLFELGGCDTGSAPDATAYSAASSTPTYPTTDVSVSTGASGAPGVNNGVYFGVLYAALDSSGVGGNGDDPQEGFSNQLTGFTYIRSWAESNPVTPSAKVGAYFKPITDGSAATLTADREYGDSGGSSPKAFSNAGVLIFIPAAAAGVSTPDPDRVRIFAQDIGTRSTLRVKDDQGDEATVVLNAEGEVCRIRVVSVSVDIPNTSAKSGGTLNLAVSGVAVDDEVFLGGADANNGRGFNLRPRSPVSTADQIDLDYFNNDSVSAQNPPAFNLKLLVIHRS